MPVTEEGVSPIQILLVEDSPGDVRLVMEALKNAEVANRLHVVSNGLDAMAFLQRQGKYSSAVRPDLVLLDLNLPKKNGRETLAEIKQDPQLRRIPVVIFTISKAEDDIIRAYDLNANCYITKPVDFEQFTAVIKSIENFWLTTVKLPPN